MSEKLLVTGASGQLGQRVLTHLLEANGVAPGRIVAASRNPDKLAAFAARGIETRRLDFEDASSLAPAFAGIDRVLLVSTDALGEPGRRLTQHKAAVAAAERAGVKHVVYTSMPNPDGSLIPFAPDHLGTEQALAASSLGWTILRNSWYFENLFGSLPGVIASGKWYTAAGEGKSSQLPREDCARAAAAALAAANTNNAIYDITGPQKMTTAEVAKVVSEVFGKPIEVVPVTDEQLIQGMVAHGVPEFLAPVYASFDTNTAAGNMDLLTTHVEDLTGAAPMTIRDFFLANKAAFAA